MELQPQDPHMFATAVFLELGFEETPQLAAAR
jgi:hypothetical protein